MPIGARCAESYSVILPRRFRVRTVVVGLGHAVIHHNGYAPRLVPSAVHARGGGAGGGGETKAHDRPMFRGRNLKEKQKNEIQVQCELRC